MIQTIIGEKIDQTQKFLADGSRVAITQIHVPDNSVVQVKTHDTDKYQALQIGFGKKKKPTKATLGHSKKAGLNFVPRKLKEVRFEATNQDADGMDNLIKAGSQISVDSIFKPGDIVDVTGKSKGKGFAGVVKRHNFRGGPKTHGQSDRLRAPGSIGQTTTPGRVYKGKRMAGRMGQDKVTIKNLKIISIDSDTKNLFVSGLVPGAKKSIVFITRTGEDKKFTPLFEPEPKTPKEAVASQAELTEETKPTETAATETPTAKLDQPEKKEVKDTKSEEKSIKEPEAPEEVKEPEKGGK